MELSSKAKKIARLVEKALRSGSKSLRVIVDHVHDTLYDAMSPLDGIDTQSDCPENNPDCEPIGDGRD